MLRRRLSISAWQAVCLCDRLHLVSPQGCLAFAVVLQTALDKADEAQKEMESIPEAPTLQEQRNGTGACPYCLLHPLADNALQAATPCCACNTLLNEAERSLLCMELPKEQALHLEPGSLQEKLPGCLV